MPRKAEDTFFLPLSFLLSAVLGLNENQGRIDKTTNNEDGKNGQIYDVDIIIGCNYEESINHIFRFLSQT